MSVPRFKDLSAVEQGALKKAWEEHAIIERFDTFTNRWQVIEKALWLGHTQYRIQPMRTFEQLSFVERRALLDAWDNGTTIEFFDNHLWCETHPPRWYPNMVYRIKPGTEAKGTVLAPEPKRAAPAAAPAEWMPTPLPVKPKPAREPVIYGPQGGALWRRTGL